MTTDESTVLERRPILLADPISDFSLKVAFDGLRPKAPTFPTPVRLTWAGFDKPLSGAEIELDGSALLLKMTSDGPDDPLKFIGLHRIVNQPAEITLEDGSRIHCPFAKLTRSGIADLSRKGGVYFGHLKLVMWEWLPSDPTGVVLVGEAKGLETDVAENLSVRSKRVGSHCHFRAQGFALWHLIKTDNSHLALVACNVDHGLARALRGDLTAMQFVFGTGINLDVLWLLDDSNAIVGGVGLGRGTPQTHRSRRPTPSGPLEEHCWNAHLFRLVAQRLAGGDEGITTPIAGYLDALRGHIHGGYLLAQVALEAFCAAAIPKGPTRQLVTSTDAWRAWVETNKDEIAGFCNDSESARKLVEKLKHSVTQRPTGEVVEAAFCSWGINLPRELVTEIGHRSRSAHRFVMFDEESCDIQNEANRVHKVQFLLAAAIARSVGYTGPLVGWERDPSGDLIEPDFWSSEVPHEANEWFACWRDREENEEW